LAGGVTALVTTFITLSYLILYTPMKPRSSLCMLVGAVPGALPPVIGWVAARGSLDIALGKILESRVIEKEYLAIVHGHVSENRGLIDASLGKDEKSIVAVKDCVRPDGAPALRPRAASRGRRAPGSRSSGG
jgi:hypothetical protein